MARWGISKRRTLKPIYILSISLTPQQTDLSTDPLLTGRPIALSRKDGHASWVSTTVLEIMESSGKLPSTIQGGKILRDSDGKPTGIFLDNALSLIPLPPWSSSQLTEYFDRTMKDALSVGLTSIHDADAGSGGGREGNVTVREGIEFFLGKARAGKLPVSASSINGASVSNITSQIRLYLMAHVPIPTPNDNETSTPDAYAQWETLKMSKLINYGRNGRLNLRSVKLFTDGEILQRKARQRLTLIHTHTHTHTHRSFRIMGCSSPSTLFR